MRYTPDDEIQFRCSELDRIHRSDWCALVFDAAVGRTISDIVEVMGRSTHWVRYHLARHAIELSVGAEVEDTNKETDAIVAVRKEDKLATSKSLWIAIDTIVSHYGPKPPEKPAARYLNNYEAEGFVGNSLNLIAKAHQAGRKALSAKAIKLRKGKARLNPPQELTWLVDIQRVCSSVEMAAKFFDSAQMSDLRKKDTAVRIAKTHKLWMDQIERIRNLHPEFDAVFMEYDTQNS